MKITCVVDDRVLPGSGLKAEHGISFVIEAEGRLVLFDTGQSSSVLLHNLASLGLAPEQFDALICSHAHYDHTGGLDGFLSGLRAIPLYACPDLLRERFRKTKTCTEQIGPSFTPSSLVHRVQLHLNSAPVEVVPNVWTTGEITNRLEPEGRSAHHLIRQGQDWAPDPYQDDLSVVLKVADGLVLVCGCCHAGLLNTLAHVRAHFGSDPMAIVGGLHLVHADMPALDHVVAMLRQIGSPQLWIGHCTGDRAAQLLEAALGNLVSPCHAGTVLQF